ncbi:hypothetical protein N9831_02465 [Amylibacter sp.]|nr:hypothetical protein [Amylibacter sp.]
MKYFLTSCLFLFLFGSTVHARDCNQAVQAKNYFSNLYKNENHSIYVKQLQTIIGVNVDGRWGIKSETTYENYISDCLDNKTLNVHSKKNLKIVDGSNIIDYYTSEILYEEIPYIKCELKKIPIYGKKNHGNDDIGSFIGGAVIGGIIGKVVTEDDGAAALGAILGGALANESQKNEPVEKIIAYEKKEICTEEIKIVQTEKEVYSHSSIEFNLDGYNYSSKFIKRKY